MLKVHIEKVKSLAVNLLSFMKICLSGAVTVHTSREMKSAHSCVCLQNVLPVDQASDSDINNLSSSHSDTSLPGGPQHLPMSNNSAEPQPSQLNEDYDSDDCVIVGYVKPRHERTPEIITLVSSEPEAEEGEVVVSPVMFI
jgi:hypothetical protein